MERSVIPGCYVLKWRGWIRRQIQPFHFNYANPLIGLAFNHFEHFSTAFRTDAPYCLFIIPCEDALDIHNIPRGMAFRTMCLHPITSILLQRK